MAMANHLLSAGHEVSLLCPCSRQTDLSVLPQKFRWHFFMQGHRLGHLFHPTLFHFLIQEASAGCQRIVLSFPFQIFPVLVVSRMFRIPFYLDAHNVEHVRFASMGKRLMAAMIFPLEFLAARMAREIFAVSREDQFLFKKKFGRHARLVPNGVDTKVFLPARKPPGAPGVLFFGNLAYGPNRRAVSFINEDLAPMLQVKLPRLVLRIAGLNPPSLRYASNVEVLGAVENIQDVIHQADLVIAPLDASEGGGGTRLKIVEAMACGKNVLCTEAAAAGLPEDIRHALRVVSLEDFAFEIVNFFAGRWIQGHGSHVLQAAQSMDWKNCFKQMSLT